MHDLAFKLSIDWASMPRMPPACSMRSIIDAIFSSSAMATASATSPSVPKSGLLSWSGRNAAAHSALWSVQRSGSGSSRVPCSGAGACSSSSAVSMPAAFSAAGGIVTSPRRPRSRSRRHARSKLLARSTRRVLVITCNASTSPDGF